jgi:transmembrane secretion effector
VGRDQEHCVYQAPPVRLCQVTAECLREHRERKHYLPAAVFYTPAIQARTPEIVGTGPLLSSASSLTAMTSGVVRLIGGPLGGVLFAFLGIRWLICADTASYLIAAGAALMTFRHPSRPETAQDEVRARFPVAAAANGVRASLVAGVRALRRSPAARGLLSVQVLFLAANASLSAVLIPFGIRRLGGSTQTGLLMAALGAGFLLGAPLLRILLDRVQARHTMAASLAITAAGYVGLFSSTTIAAALPAAVAIGMTGAVVLSVPVATVQRVTGNEVLGRITAAFTTGGAAATMTGAVAGPLVAQAIQLTGAAVAAASGTLAAAALALLIVLRTMLPTQPPAGRKSAAPE